MAAPHFRTRQHRPVTFPLSSLLSEFHALLLVVLFYQLIFVAKNCGAIRLQETWTFTLNWNIHPELEHSPWSGTFCMPWALHLFVSLWASCPGLLPWTGTFTLNWNIHPDLEHFVCLGPCICLFRYEHPALRSSLMRNSNARTKWMKKKSTGLTIRQRLIGGFIIWYCYLAGGADEQNAIGGASAQGLQGNNPAVAQWNTLGTRERVMTCV